MVSSSLSAQTIDYYHQKFLNEAALYNYTIRTTPPAFIVTGQDLYLGKQPVNAYVDYTTRTIYFNRYTHMYNNNLRILVYHELGHYYLDRRHTTTNSIMNPDIWQTRFWDTLQQQEKDLYLRELFKLY